MTKTAPPDTKRLACTWCGLPSGLPNVTLHKAVLTRSDGYDTILLCEACLQEYGRFGRKLPFADWLALYLFEHWRWLSRALSMRTHVQQVIVQWRFRVRGERVRAAAADRALLASGGSAR